MPKHGPRHFEDGGQAGVRRLKNVRAEQRGSLQRFDGGGEVDDAEQLAQAILGLISQKFQEGGQILPGTGQVQPNREIPQQVLGGLSQATRDEDPSAFTALIDIIRKIIARQTKSEFVLDEPTAQTARRG